jgi:hypothetical protein
MLSIDFSREPPLRLSFANVAEIPTAYTLLPGPRSSDAYKFIAKRSATID